MGFRTTLQFIWKHPLNRYNRLAAIGRFASWQLGSRLLPGVTELPFVERTSLFASRGMTGATGNWYCGLHEVQDMAFVLHLLRPEDLFVDVGANVGSYTVLAAGAVGAEVISVEPIPATFAWLERNIMLNSLQQRVNLRRVGLSDQEGILRFTSNRGTVNHILAPGEEAPSVEVPVVTLDSLLKQQAPRLIKIDVEGHEWAVLQGAKATLANPELLAVIMETNGSGARYGISDDSVISFLEERGFMPFGYNPFQKILESYERANGNTIFIRNEAAVCSRLESSRRYRLVNGEI